MVRPSKFIAIMEENGLIVPLGTWVLQDACRQCAAWQEGELQGVGIAVNVSSMQFACPDFVDVVAQTLERTALPPSLLELELTESVFVDDIAHSARTLTKLRDLGVTIALDDFGTGYSSLSYLQELPLDAVKIDQSFVAATEGRRRGAAVLRCVVDLAHAYGLRVTAEGVETASQRDLLEGLGCDEIQGYSLGRPSFEVAGFDWKRECPDAESNPGEYLRYLSEQLSMGETSIRRASAVTRRRAPALARASEQFAEDVARLRFSLI